jgi:hypothetical protein
MKTNTISVIFVRIRSVFIPDDDTGNTRTKPIPNKGLSLVEQSYTREEERKLRDAAAAVEFSVVVAVPPSPFSSHPPHEP